MRPKNELERVILHLLKSHIAVSESLYPGSGETAIRVCLDAASYWMSQEGMGRSPADLLDAVNRAIEAASSERLSSRRLTLEEAESMVSPIPNPARNELVGMLPSLPLGTSISVRKGRGSRTVIETRKGCSIRVDPSSPHLTNKLIDPKIVLVDGVIDSVSQLHRVLNDSADSGQCYLICCRQTSPDVEETVRVNLARGTIRVALLRCRLDDRTVGSIDDIAAYSGASVITAASGESVSSAFERLSSFKGEAWLEGDQLRLSGDPSELLSRHVSSLRRDASVNNQEVADFFGAWLLGLASHKVEIIVGEEDARISPRLFERIDVEMRSLMSCFSRGVSSKRSPDFASLGEMGGVIQGSAQWGLPVPGADTSGIISGLRFARDLCTIGFAILQQPALASPSLQ
jgi:hypothetical protein